MLYAEIAVVLIIIGKATNGNVSANLAKLERPLKAVQLCMALNCHYATGLSLCTYLHQQRKVLVMAESKKAEGKKTKKGKQRKVGFIKMQVIPNLQAETIDDKVTTNISDKSTLIHILY